MTVSLEAQGTNAYNRYAMCPAEWIFGYYKLNILTLARITTIMYGNHLALWDKVEIIDWAEH